jgi:hypothetical protein
VRQQIRSFSATHAAELEGVARDLEAVGQPDLAARLRVFVRLHTQETGLILDELGDLGAVLERPTAQQTDAPSEPVAPARQADSVAQPDPAANSSARDRWLGEAPREAPEQAERPRSRRDFLQRSDG